MAMQHKARKALGGLLAILGTTVILRLVAIPEASMDEVPTTNPPATTEPRRPKSPAASATPASTAIKAPANAAIKAPATPMGPAADTSAPALAASVAAAESATAAPHHRAPGDDLAADLSAVMTKFPYLARNRQLSQKALLLGEERQELGELLSDPETIETVFSDLKAYYSNLDAKGQSLVNIQRLAFVRSAIQMPKNPERTVVIAKLQDFVHFMPTANRLAAMSVTAQREFLGDKITGLYILGQYAPDHYHQLKEGAIDPRLQKIIRYAEDHQGRLNRL